MNIAQKIVLAMNEWLRWRIALMMDRFADTCWANLVTWSTYPEWHEFAEIFSARDKAGYCARNGEIPYCGKCERRPTTWPRWAFELWCLGIGDIRCANISDLPIGEVRRQFWRLRGYVLKALFSWWRWCEDDH